MDNGRRRGRFDHFEVGRARDECHELSRAVASLSAADLSGDADGVLLTRRQPRLGEGGQAAVHLLADLLVNLLLREDKD